MPQGVAVPVGRLMAIAPSYVTALEKKIGESRAAETYGILKTICDPNQICVGMKSQLAGEQNENILWLIAPSSTKPVAAVELALDEETAAATFVYNIDGDRGQFIKQLNRAMEPINFKREVISMPEEALHNAGHSHYVMAVKRTAALRFMRGRLAKRIIHTDSWENNIRNYFC